MMQRASCIPEINSQKCRGFISRKLRKGKVGSNHYPKIPACFVTLTVSAKTTKKNLQIASARCRSYLLERSENSHVKLQATIQK